MVAADRTACSSCKTMLLWAIITQATALNADRRYINSVAASSGNELTINRQSRKNSNDSTIHTRHWKESYLINLFASKINSEKLFRDLRILSEAQTKDISLYSSVTLQCNRTDHRASVSCWKNKRFRLCPNSNVTLLIHDQSRGNDIGKRAFDR